MQMGEYRKRSVQAVKEAHPLLQNLLIECLIAGGERLQRGAFGWARSRYRKSFNLYAPCGDTEFHITAD